MKEIHIYAIISILHISLRCQCKVKICFFIVIYIIISNITPVHYFIIFHTSKSYSDVSDMMKAILLYVFTTIPMPSQKNILHCFIYIIFFSAAHMQCIIILDAYQSYSNVLDMMKKAFISAVVALKVALQGQNLFHY